MESSEGQRTSSVARSDRKYLLIILSYATHNLSLVTNKKVKSDSLDHISVLFPEIKFANLSKFHRISEDMSKNQYARIFIV